MRFADGPYDPGGCFVVGAGIGTEGQVLSSGTGIEDSFEGLHYPYRIVGLKKT
jgi:hypothetical protein